MNLNSKKSILLDLSRDGLEAYLTLAIEEDSIEKEISYEEVMREINKFIKIGLNQDTVKNMIFNKIYNESLCIAKGLPPEDGQDGYIRYYFKENKKIAPKINKDGSVDYRELNLVNNVKEGDVLAEIILPKEGKNGTKVTGESIPYKPGKTPFFKYGKNVKVSDDGLLLIATKGGQVKFGGDKIVVLDVLELDSVDNSTGNIYFNGTIKVKENIVNGFQVKAQEDIEVSGVVEGAILESNGDILIRQGIQGYNSGKVVSGGNLTSKFIENSFIFCNKNLTAEAIMHSEVTCRGDIKVIGKKGLIVGGICRARREIYAQTIGSRMATATVLEVGLDPELKLRFQKLEENINSSKENINKIDQSLLILENMIKENRIDEEKKMLYEKLIHTKIEIEENLNNLNREYIVIKSQLSNISSGKIKVQETIYPGVKIVIGNSIMFIRDEMSHCTFYSDEGEVKVGPF
ncbi:DUF342 domain-containing protein [Sporanaerobacter acetigenes]|uniref:DUF342 domain-containing protein n=1 Tax=Sporanaerobacter acetigenes TaxID=165813 RepID=UPI00130504E3|nr:FapA family protein [Sporanaerobacter acetigenes]